jgi:TolA-binding protein
MSLINPISRLFLVLMISGSMVLSGCSYIPWIGGDNEDDLAFEEDFPFDDEDSGGLEGDRSASSDDDDFFAEDSQGGSDDAFISDDGFGDADDGFASIDPRTDKKELQGDVASLQTQQESLISKVRELEEILGSLGPKINATQERLEGSLSAVSGQSEYLEPEVEELKLQVARLNDEIARIKATKMSRAKSGTKQRRKARASTPPEYNQALSSYRSGNYDESILLFQSLAIGSPPDSLKDNIEFWIGSNYVKLEMYDDAITQFETVINSYPMGNKVHDSRYMLGLSYYRKGESSKAVEILQSALKGNPPAEVRGKITTQLSEIQ